MCSSSGTGRTLEWKLKIALGAQPIHSARSLALASDVESPTMRSRDDVCDEM